MNPSVVTAMDGSGHSIWTDALKQKLLRKVIVRRQFWFIREQ